jgi:hypothetical protein
MPKTAGKSLRKLMFGQEHGAVHEQILTTEKLFANHQDFFKFCIVRNPYTRFQSAYLYLKNGGNQSRYDYLAQEEMLNAFNNFEDFAENWNNNARLNSHPILKTQAYYLNYKPQNVNFIGYYEQLNKDVNYILTKLNINQSLPHLNQTSPSVHKPKLSDMSRESIYNHYQVDFKLFNYPKV